MKKVVIIGGGLAGLISAIDLVKHGVPVTLIEKKTYPFHRVCGEYISNEVVPYLKSLGVYPSHLGPALINKLQLTSTNGRSANLELDVGGFGISRYTFDRFLYDTATQGGVTFQLDTEVETVTFVNDHHEILTSRGQLQADVVIGSMGKRSKLDVHLKRSFIRKRSPYVGVKYHVKLEGFPPDLIALHNFQNGYCGISRVEDDRINLCYLTHRDNLKKYGQIDVMEKEVLFRNPFIKKIFDRAEFLFDKPETINEISFETKSPLVDHIFMAGDSAGMITPLCGNGMAMAIHSASILAGQVAAYCQSSTYTRSQLESAYVQRWRKQFAQRLWTGRIIQRLFGSDLASNFAVGLANHATPLAYFLVSRTHGKVFAENVSAPSK